MLKPNRKILRREIKKDPLLETFEKIESGFERNKKTLINVLVFFALLIFGGLILINNQKKTEIDSSSAFGAALVAYSNIDYDNAKFQFESISSSYEGTESGIFSDYYLGKIAYEMGDYNEAKLFLNGFLDNTDNTSLVCGAIKLLVDISIQENDFANCFNIIDKANKYNINRVSELELKLLKINVLIKTNDFQKAKSEIEKTLKNKKIPTYIKQRIDEFEGVL